MIRKSGNRFSEKDHAQKNRIFFRRLLVRPDLIRKTASRRSQAGFTLVEILVVITIIGLIMALVGPRVLNYLGESKAKAAKIQIESFSSALDLYYLDLGRYPNSSEGLTALTRSNNAPGWNGPYLRGGVVPNDPWGHSYVYRSPGERAPYDIISLGSDGQEGGSGTAADIASGTR
jgi:general secretion pathway protein G